MTVLLAACAPKAPPAMPGPPKHPEFVFPAVAPGASDAQLQRITRGWQYLQIDDFRNAEREFETALKRQPSFHPAETALGYLALARGNDQAAIDRFERTLKADAAYVPALIGRGLAQLELDRPEQALASFEAALASDPSLTDLRTRVNVLRFRSQQDLLARATSAAVAKQWDEARAAYQQAIAASPESAFLYRELAMVEQQAGEPDRALTHLRRALELDAADARSHAAIGGILERRGDIDAALSAYERARAIDPGEVPETVIVRLREAVKLAGLPEEYRAIPEENSLTRAQIASLIGVRLEPLIAHAKPRQVIITDIRNHWAQQWIAPVVRAGIMDTLPNYEFEPGRPVRRGEFAATVSRLLSLIGALKPQLAGKWQNTTVRIADVPASHLSYPAVALAVASGVMPLDAGDFDLLRPVSGAEAMEVIGRLDALARP